MRSVRRHFTGKTWELSYCQAFTIHFKFETQRNTQILSMLPTYKMGELSWNRDKVLVTRSATLPFLVVYPTVSCYQGTGLVMSHIMPAANWQGTVQLIMTSNIFIANFRWAKIQLTTGKELLGLFRQSLCKIMESYSGWGSKDAELLQPWNTLLVFKIKN